MGRGIVTEFEREFERLILQTRIDAGIVMHFATIDILDPFIRREDYEAQLKARDNFYNFLKDTYGPQNVIFGDAFDDTAGQVYTTPEKVGTYVTTQAFIAVHESPFADAEFTPSLSLLAA